MTATEYGNRQRLEDELAYLAGVPATLPTVAELVMPWVVAIDTLTGWAELTDSLGFIAEHYEFVPAGIVERAEALLEVLATAGEQIAQVARMATAHDTVTADATALRLFRELIPVESLRQAVRFAQVERLVRSERP